MVFLAVFGGYMFTSFILLKYPNLIHKKKQLKFRARHISHRGGEYTLCCDLLSPVTLLLRAMLIAFVISIIILCIPCCFWLVHMLFFCHASWSVHWDIFPFALHLFLAPLVYSLLFPSENLIVMVCWCELLHATHDDDYHPVPSNQGRLAALVHVHLTQPVSFQALCCPHIIVSLCRLPFFSTTFSL